MTRTWVATLAILLLPSWACMHAMRAGHTAPATTTQSATPPPAAGADAAMQMCPMAVPGTQVAASDVADGEVLTFTTGSGDVEELRRRVRAVAEMHNRHHATGTGPGHMHGDMGHDGGMMGGGMMGGSLMDGSQAAGGHGMGRMMMPPPSRASVEDIEGGARIVMTPNDLADLDELRSTVRMHVQEMQQHGCEMMGGM